MLYRPLLFPILLATLAPTCMAAGFTRVADCVSPSGRLRAEVGTDATGHLAWRLAIAGRSIIDVSRAGILVAGVDSGAAATVGKPVLRTIDQSFPWRGPETQPPDPTLFPQGIRTSWLKPGRCLWQWWAFDDPGTHWSKQKAFVDKAAALACEYYLVDEGWEHTRQEWFKPGEPDRAWPRMKELCSYAKTKGVGIWVWRGWTLNKGRQWPGLETHAKRVDFFRHCRDAGVAGAKIDFMDSESHSRLEFYQDCLRVAAENQVMVNFHGANKPTGEARTWPNEMTREGIRGLEYNKWDTSPPSHYATLPFTRLLAGHADFTPTTLNPKFLKGTTVAQQLACAVVLSTPVLCWADNPDLYLASPSLDAIRAMPVVWDETHILPQSRIGELAAFARRSGDEWWVGVINGGGPRTVELPMDFLGAGDWTADRYADGAKPADFSVTRAVVLTAAAKHKVDLAAGGGLTLRIRKK